MSLFYLERSKNVRKSQKTLLAVGATGSIGRHVVAVALRKGYSVRALVRHPEQADLPDDVDMVAGDLTKPETLSAAVQGVDAIIFTHGTYGSITQAESVDYGGVRNILSLLTGKAVQLVLMTAIGVTDRKGAHDWKRRAERLVRASSSPYTIVRPGWFDYNKAEQHRLVFLQGDTRKSGTAQDGVIARADIAEVLVSCLDISESNRKTFELVAEQGARQSDIEPLFSALEADKVGALDGARDPANMPLADEPQQIAIELEALFHEARGA